MAIDCKVEQERMELRLTGEIDHHRAGALMRELETQLDLESPRSVELDLGGVSFMDSSGIALLLRLYRSLAFTGAPVSLLTPSMTATLPSTWIFAPIRRSSSE